MGVLEEAGVEYMLTGSFTSSLYGEPRATHDIDVVVAMSADVVPRLEAAFPPPHFYLSAEAASEAIATGGMFNLLSVDEGDKVDFWLLADAPFDRSAFQRRRRVDVLGLSLQVPTPEDVILAKLRWCRLSGGSRRQFTDALRVFEVSGSQLDRAYLDTWAAALGVGDLWTRVVAEAQVLP